VTRWASIVIAAVTLWFAAWIFIPASTYSQLTFSVGAPEVSAWTIVIALVGMAFGAVRFRTSDVARTGVALNGIAILACLTIWSQLPSLIRRYDAATAAVSATPAHPLRTHPIVIRDLFRHIPTGTPEIVRNVNVMRRDSVELTADIYQPSDSGASPHSHPIVVQIYGGAWQRGHPADDATFASWLTQAGYVVIAIDYRHAPQFHWPAQLDDVDSMLVWVASNANRFNGDTSRVVLLGRSAGAQLATMAAWRNPPIHLRGVVSFYGPADLVSSYKNPPHPDPLHVRAVEEALIGGTLQAIPAGYSDASTITSIGDKPVVPSLLIYGGRDHIVEPKYGAMLVSKLKASGTKVGFIEIPWADHAFDAVFNGPSSQLSLYYVERFLEWATQHN
jgi:acetyl esterase/lipase